MNPMGKLVLCLFFALLLAPFSPAFAQKDEGQNEKAAVAAAESFLALVDAGQYARSWAEASSLFKSQVTREEWVSKISRLRPLFGPALRRTVKSTQYLTSPPGAPDGEYVLILFQTSFQNKKEALETVTPVLDQDGEWRVSGYFIK